MDTSTNTSALIANRLMSDPKFADKVASTATAKSIKQAFDEAMNHDKTIVEASDQPNEDGTTTYYVTLGDWLIDPDTIDTIRQALAAMGASLEAILSTGKYSLRFHVNA